ncbi:leucine-rich repeat and coiled-coil domain-containing protein 1-like [Babylonia areolata]|uniref:leucine-rich repeat and coiled-coil domain-containing protein 1-like n=1 Tax=Babylonia areolata TaxID=304850 RepID=UPI003FD5DA6C
MATGGNEKVNLDSPELSLIDSGIHSMRDVPLAPHLQSINLHSNYIQRIQGLELLRNLRHLDLSANQIFEISGLDGLVSLKTLNLSCNLISVVEGLSCLRSLVKLNLSYNQIEDLSGLRSLGISECKLTQLELHGNKLRSVQHVHRSVALCSSLQHLVVSQDGSSNPLCHQPGYEAELLGALPQLQTLNGVDRHGRRSLPSDMVTDVPELEAYLDFLLSGASTSASTSSDTVQQQNIKTPKIDQMLERFRERGINTTEISSASFSAATDADSNSGSRAATPGRGRKVAVDGWGKKTGGDGDQDERLAQLEKEIHRLQLAQNKMSSGLQSPQIQSPSRWRDGEDTEEELEPVRERASAKDAKQKKSNLASVAEGKKGTGGIGSTMKGPQAQMKKNTGKKSSGVEGAGVRRKGAEKVNREVSSSSSVTSPPSVPRPHTSSSDHRHREELQMTYVQLLKEMEGERERRWKAEQAARKLADHVKELQHKNHEESEFRSTALEATDRLKQSVMNEREIKLRLQDQVTELKGRVEELEEQLSRTRQAEDESRAAARQIEQTMAEYDRRRLQAQAHEAKRLQDSELKSAAIGKEAELLRHTVQSQKVQIHQLQELLASREQHHKQELSERYRLDSKELQEVLQKEVHTVESRHQHQLNNCQEKIDTLTSQYSELEDEFRLALQIEANRFKEVQTAYERVSEENAENKQLLLAAQRKDEQSASMLAELTALVKEQKGRIAELSRAKQEQCTQYRERVDGLEASVEEARKRMVQFELLKQENVRLQSTVHAQESVIEGLKAERRLWGQELAQQGASLSQDRGRLEAKIDGLNHEVNTLKKQLEKETDLVRIKTKMVDDQTETIRKLKEGLVERDEQIREGREETLKVQRNLEDQLNEERAALQDTQELLEEAQRRKSELKQQVSDLQTELDASQKAHQQLSARWREKSELIGGLEKQVSSMQSTWQDKEKALRQERDKAVEAASLAVEKMRGMDDAFRRQLEAAEKSHREELARMTNEKQRDVDIAEQKVVVVEEEMRELLRETELSKRGMEEKVKRLTQALGDLQSDLL